MKMLRGLLIQEELLEKVLRKSLKNENGESVEINRNLIEKLVLKKLRKKRSVKKYRKYGVSRQDLQEIIELAHLTGLEVFGGLSDFEIIKNHPKWCNNCGKCCRESSPIFIHRDELNPLLLFNPDLKNEIVTNPAYPEHYKFKEDLPCKFHDIENKKCSIYDSRPQVCQSYPLILVEVENKPHYITHLQPDCNYVISLILEKSMILFDESLKKLNSKN